MKKALVTCTKTTPIDLDENLAWTWLLRYRNAFHGRSGIATFAVPDGCSLFLRYVAHVCSDIELLSRRQEDRGESERGWVSVLGSASRFPSLDYRGPVAPRHDPAASCGTDGYVLALLRIAARDLVSAASE